MEVNKIMKNDENKSNNKILFEGMVALDNAKFDILTRCAS